MALQPASYLGIVSVALGGILFPQQLTADLDAGGTVALLAVQSHL